MSIYIPDDPNQDMPNELRSDIEEHVCFLCHSHLFEDEQRSTGGVVTWLGSSGFIVLHQPCAELLSIQLIQDARSLVSRTKRNAKLRSELPQDASNLWHTKNN